MYAIRSYYDTSQQEPYVGNNFDTLYSISMRFNVTVNDILALNPGIIPHKLHQGQEIIEFKGDKMPIGSHYKENKSFTSYNFV